MDVSAVRVRSPTYRSRYAIAPLPSQTSLLAKWRTLSAGPVLGSLVTGKKHAKRDHYHIAPRTQSSLAGGSLRRRGADGGQRVQGDRFQLRGQGRRDPRLQQRAVAAVLGAQHLSVGVGARQQVTALVRHYDPDLGVQPRQGGLDGVPQGGQ